MKVQQEQIFGEILSARDVHRILSGSGRGKASVVGYKKVRELMRKGEIKSYLKDGRYITLKRELERWIKETTEHGSEVLGIDVPYNRGN